jgi:hypothetical protein
MLMASAQNDNGPPDMLRPAMAEYNMPFLEMKRAKPNG